MPQFEFLISDAERPSPAASTRSTIAPLQPFLLNCGNGDSGGVQMGKHPVLRVLSRIFLVAGLVTLAISFVLFSVGRTGSDILLGLFSIGLGIFSLLLMSIGAVILFFLERWDRPELR